MNPEFYTKRMEVSRDTTYTLIRQPLSKSGKFTCINAELAIILYPLSFRTCQRQGRGIGLTASGSGHGRTVQSVARCKPYHQGQTPKQLSPMCQ